MRALGVAAKRIAGPIVAAQGGGIVARLKANWAAAVGDEFAAVAWPMALGRDGALKAAVAPGFGLDVQHRAPLLTERINLFLGRAAIVRIVIVPGRPPLAAPPPPPPAQPLGAAQQAALDKSLAEVADPELRAALAALGQFVLRGAK